jgi:hypothetical protein
MRMQFLSVCLRYSVLLHYSSTRPDLILGFIDYLAEVSQGMIEDRITVSTLVNDIGLFIGMVSRVPKLSVPSFEDYLV